MDTIYTLHFAVISRVGYYLDYAVQYILEGSILIRIRNRHNFGGNDSRNARDYAVFMLLDPIYTNHCEVFSGVDTINAMH